MSVNCVILARDNSRRCPHKNWRPFVGGQSLVDVTARRLRECLPPHRIFISGDNPDRERDADRLGVRFLLRPTHLCGDGDYPITDLVREVAEQLPDRKPVAWCAVTDPLFCQHSSILQAWERFHATGGDSLAMAYHAPHYLLNAAMQPEGWGYGPQMVASQELRPWFWTSFAMQICRWSVARETGHYHGSAHRWFVAHGPSVDIDTEEDFRLAQLLYRHRDELPHGRQPDRFHLPHYVDNQ